MALRKRVGRAVGSLAGLDRSAARGATSGFGASIGLATAVGLGVAMNRADMGTYAMDTIDEVLTGRTDSDVVYTGAERSLMDPFMHEVGSRFQAPIRVPSIKYMNPVLNGYAKSMGEQIESDNFAFQRSRGYNAPMPTQGNFQRGVDGSLVFGMFNLR